MSTPEPSQITPAMILSEVKVASGLLRDAVRERRPLSALFFSIGLPYVVWTLVSVRREPPKDDVLSPFVYALR